MTPAEAAANQGVRALQALLLRHLIALLFWIGIPTLALAAYYVARDGNWGLPLVYAALFGGLAYLRFGAVGYNVRVGVLLGSTYAFALLSAFRAGLSSSIRLFLVAFVFIAVVFIGPRAGYAAVAVAVVTLGVFAGLFMQGVLVIPAAVQVLSDKLSAWASYTVTWVFIITFILGTLNRLVLRVRETYTDFERQVAARTAELHQAYTQLQGQAQVKAQFLALVSHELYTPLMAAQGSAEMVTAGVYGAVPAAAATAVERITANTQRMAALLTNLIDYTRLEAGQLTLLARPVALADLLAAAAAQWGPVVAAASERLETTADPALPKKLMGAAVGANPQQSGA